MLMISAVHGEKMCVAFSPKNIIPILKHGGGGITLWEWFSPNLDDVMDPVYTWD